MEGKKELHFAVAKYIVDRLQDVGKTKMQKIAYFLQNVFGVSLNYSFKTYYYGTYSEELDNELTDMNLQGYLRIAPDLQGYGYHIQPGGEPIEKSEEILRPFKKRIDDCLTNFGSLDATKLELLSALHFVSQTLDKAQKSEVVARVSVLKPRFARTDIEQAYDDLQELIS